MRLSRVLAPALAVVAVVGCVDEPVSTLAPGDARVVIASEFSYANSSAVLPIEIVRLTAFFSNGDTAGVNEERVGSNDDEFEVDAIVHLNGLDSATVDILVELISDGSGAEIVEYSGMVGPIEVRAGETAEEHSPVFMIRGPIENLGVFSIDVFGPPSLQLGQSHQVMASVGTEGTDHQVVWSSSDPTVVLIAPLVGDTVDIFALQQGEAWIVGAAGAHADSFLVAVTFTGGGPVAQVIAFPDSAVMVPGATRQWQAFAFDETEFPTFPSFTWESLDQTIATVNSTGVVTAHQLGRARIVVSAEGFADTAIVNVEALPPGVDVMWQGGTPGAEGDWFTADNWSPARVPTASDVVYIPGGASWIELTADAEVGGFLADTLGGYSIHIGENTLTVHGDLLAPFIFGDSAATVVLDGAGADVYGFLPNVDILAEVNLADDLYVYGDLTVSNAHLEIGSLDGITVDGTMTATNTTVAMRHNDTTFTSGYLEINEDLIINGGSWGAGITGGYIDVFGDITVTACGSFAPQGGSVTMISDTATIDIGCAGPTLNRFNDLFIYRSSVTHRVLELASDVYVLGELYLDGGDSTLVLGNGHTFQARYGTAYYVTFDHTFIEVFGVSASDYFNTDSVVITGMTGETRPQVRYYHPGIACFGTGCYGPIDVHFDPTSAGAYIEVTDTDSNGDSLVVYLYNNPGDGPQRTITSGDETRVYWADVPEHMQNWFGGGQSGPEFAPLPDSLMVRVIDYIGAGVDGVVVDWTVLSGGGSVSPTTSVTDEDGFASTEFTLGSSTAGTQQVRATSVSVPQDTAYFSAFASPAGVAPQPGAPATVFEAPTAQPMPARRSAPETFVMPARPIPTIPDSSRSGRDR